MQQEILDCVDGTGANNPRERFVEANRLQTLVPELKTLILSGYREDEQEVLSVLLKLAKT